MTKLITTNYLTFNLFEEYYRNNSENLRFLVKLIECMMFFFFLDKLVCQKPRDSQIYVFVRYWKGKCKHMYVGNTEIALGNTAGFYGVAEY